MTPAATVSAWPRERVAAAVAYARRMASIPDGPLPADPRKWPDATAAVVEAADALIRANPAKHACSNVQHGV